MFDVVLAAMGNGVAGATLLAAAVIASVFLAFLEWTEDDDF